MNPLSTRKYFASNMKKVIGQVISLALGVAIIYYIFAIGGGFLDIMLKSEEAPFSDKSRLMQSKSQNSIEELEACYNELINNKATDKVLKFEYNYSSMKTILGSTGCYVYGLKSKDIKYIFDRENFKLIDGRLPENNDEMIASEEYVKSNGYKIGDYIGSEVRDSEYLNGKKKLVGMFKGKEITAYYVNENIKNYGYLLLFNNFEEVKKISDRYNNNITVKDKNTNINFMSSLKISLVSFGVFLTGFMIVIELIILNNLMYINLFSRKEELALLYAIGQSDKKVRKMILAEQGTIIFAGFVLGAFMGIIGVIFFNSVYLEAIGQKFSIFNMWYIVGGLVLSLIMLLTSRLPLRKFFKKVDRVVVLEGA